LLDTNDRQKRQTQYQRAKTDLDTTFQLIVNAVQEQQTSKNPVQRAIELLQQEYSIKLTSDELLIEPLMFLQIRQRLLSLSH
jgi:cation transport ATPase